MRHLFRIIACMAAAAAFCLVMNIQAEARDSSGDIVIIVDPGHGGNDGGAVSAYDTEAELNWNIAVALKAELQTYNGVKVYLTRGSAEWNSNAARGRMGAQLGADLFVSVHNNSGTGSSANGVQVYGTVNAAYKASIQTLCNNIASHVSALGLTNGGYHTRVSTNDSSRDYYTMLDEAVKCGIPGLIIEHCYLSNPSDAEFIHNEENQKKCGIADATAIAEYYGLTKRGVYAGSEITLLRTYSAHMLGNLSGTYTSSDNSVAYVNESGLITAVGAGSAVITCTGADGQKESVTINVPQTQPAAIAAGINPTFYDADKVASYDKSTVMVKAVYTDGSARQLSEGYTLGEITDSGNGAYDVPVSYQGLSCSLRLYGTGASGSYSLDNYKVTGTNKDILVYPAIYNGINTGISITSDQNSYTGTAGTPVETPVEEPTEAVTEEPSQAPTQEPATTPAEEPSETQPPETSEAVSESQEETESETETETGADTKNDETDKKSDSITVVLLVAAAVVLAVGAAVAVIFALKRKREKQNE